MNRADALKKATAALIESVGHTLGDERVPGWNLDWLDNADKWANVILALRFASPTPIVVEVAK